MSWLENAISGCTIPSHNKVRNHIVSCDDNGDGFVATYIPKCEIAPLMTTVGSTIYIRSGFQQCAGTVFGYCRNGSPPSAAEG